MSYLEKEAKAQLDAGVSRQEVAKRLGLSEARLEQVILGDWVVRVVVPNSTRVRFGGFLEALAFSGLVEIHRDNDLGVCFDILAPRHELSARWSERLASRLESSGFNAVKAPRWRDA